MMRTTTSVKKKRFFLPYKVHFFAETKDTFEYLMVWLKIEGAAMPLKIIEAPSSF